MRRCTLCGGKLALDGKCTECGLDNTKNDKKYRLNEHNEKAMRLHRGDCGENLNQDHGSRKKEEKPGRVEAFNRSASRSQSAQTAELVRREKKKAQERSQTGAVKKKKKRGCLGWIVLVFAVFGALGDISEEFIYEIESFIEENFRSPQPAFEAVTDEDYAEIHWNEDVDQFYTESLGAGIFTGGYDIPAGTYQLTCTDGNAYVYWWNPKTQEGGAAYLYSEIDQIAYEAEMEEPCEFSQYSEMFELEEGGILYIDLPAGMSIAGYKNSPEGMKERTPQNITDQVVCETPGNITAGEDFAAGTYDIVGEGGYGIFLDIDRNGSYYYVRLGDGEVFQRFPFSDGTSVDIELYGDAAVHLIPSY